MNRITEIRFESKETRIIGRLNLDGQGKVNVVTPFDFLSHLLETFGFYSGFDLEMQAEYVRLNDWHHLLEDCSLAIGRAIFQITSTGPALSRYGFFVLAMDETLLTVALDLSRRAYFALHQTGDRKVSEELWIIPESGWALARSLQATLHCKLEAGESAHHINEAFFKALGFALKQALQPNDWQKVFSTKGKL